MEKNYDYVEHNKKLKRSSDYRKKYFSQNKGLFGFLYFCPYCGKFMINKSKMEIDHIYGVRHVQIKRRLRRKFSNFEDGINNFDNLTVCCKKCNKKKGMKGGLWIFRGRYGVYFMPVLRILIYLIIMYVMLNYKIIFNFLKVVLPKVGEHGFFY